MHAEFTTFGVAPEGAFGTWPTANKQLLNVDDIRPTRNRNMAAPPWYTGDRRNFKLEITDQEGALTIPSALQYENLLPLLEQFFGSSRGSAKSVVGTDISATDGVISTVGAADFSVFEVGDFLVLDGAGIGANNPVDWYGPVLAKDATTLTLGSVQAQLVDFAAGGQVRIRSRRLVDGTTESSFAWEAQLVKGINQFLRGEGYKSSRYSVNWSGGGFATEEFQMMGQEWAPASASAASGSVASKKTGGMKGITYGKGGVGRIFLADGTTALGAPTSLFVTQWGLALQAALGSVKGLGFDGPAGIDEGGQDGSQLTAQVRFDDAARTEVADKIAGNVTMQGGISVRDAQGNRLFYFVPAASCSGDPQFGARGSVVVQPVTLGIHDPAKDDTSTYYNAGAGLGYQVAMFFVPNEVLP